MKTNKKLFKELVKQYSALQVVKAGYASDLTLNIIERDDFNSEVYSLLHQEEELQNIALVSIGREITPIDIYEVIKG